MPLSALEQVQRLLQPAHTIGYFRGLMLARDIISGKEVLAPSDYQHGFVDGLHHGYEILQECGDKDATLLRIDDLLLRSHLERL